MEWTDENIETLRKLCAQGLPFSVIGARMGITRSAAIGKASRLRIGKSPSKPTAADRKPVTNFGKRILTPPHIVQTKRLEAMKPPVPKKLDADEPAPLNLDLLDLTETSCRWPVTGEPPHKFCGHEKSFGVSYCSFHATLSVAGRPTTSRGALPLKRAA